MSKLTFTNALGQTVEFSATSDYKWRQVDDLGGVGAVSQTTSSPYQDGSTPAGASYFQASLVKVDFVMVSATVNTLIRTLNNRLNPKLGIGTLAYEVDGVTRVFDKVKVKSMPTKILENAKSGATFQFSSVIFDVFNPLFSDAAYTEVEIVTSQNLMEFPLDITETYEFAIDYLDGVPVVNSGDVECPITVVVDGPITQPLTIENTTTGEKIVIGLDLLNNERLTITTDIDNTNVIKTNLITSTQTVAFEYIDITNTTFFQLPVGTSNIQITSDAGDVEVALIKYKNKYVGV